MPEFLDFESSGLGEFSYPIQVGYTLNNEYFSILIKPIEGWDYWDSIAEQDYHHISQERLILEGLDPIKVIEELNNKLSGIILYSDSLNFDSFWLNKLYSINNIEPTFKLRSIQSLLATIGVSDYSFFERKEEMVEFDKVHDAGYDAFLNKKVFNSFNI